MLISEVWAARNKQAASLTTSRQLKGIYFSPPTGRAQGLNSILHAWLQTPSQFLRPNYFLIPFQVLHPEFHSIVQSCFKLTAVLLQPPQERDCRLLPPNLVIMSPHLCVTDTSHPPPPVWMHKCSHPQGFTWRLRADVRCQVSSSVTSPPYLLRQSLSLRLAILAGWFRGWNSGSHCCTVNT